jgi:5'-methylthioadenosine phosphorylase
VMAHVTDYDVWHSTEDPVTVEQVIQILNQNTQHAQQALRNLLRDDNLNQSCTCEKALENAIITRRNTISQDTRKRLGLLLDKYLA